MAPPISFAKTSCDCPLFAAEFDPYARGYLVVAGGGGESHSGIPNKLTLVDTSSRHEISSVAELDLSRNEDSVQSLASLATKDGLITFAGINSSIADQKADKNEHLRSFVIDVPPRKRPSDEKSPSQPVAKIAADGKVSLFTTSTATRKETYQRLTRLSPVQKRNTPNRRLGAIASRLSSTNEIIVFDATTSTPSAQSVCARIPLKIDDRSVEPNDIDLAEPTEGTFALVYCTDYDVYLYTLNYDFTQKHSISVFPSDPLGTRLHGVPRPDGSKEVQSRSKIRCLRWLTEKHVLLVTNKSGVIDLIVSRSEPTRPGPGLITLRKRLPNHLKSVVSMDVCPLDSDPASGERQIVIAVAGQDSSICILSINYLPKSPDVFKQTSGFTDFTTLRNVHDNAITQICFSNFFEPKQDPTSNTSIAFSQQYIQLASVSLSGTVVVDTITLSSIPLHPGDTPDIQQKSPAVRWTLSTSGAESLRTWSGLILVGFMVLISAILLQSYLSPESSALSYAFSQVQNILPPGAIPPYLRGSASNIKHTITSVVEQAQDAASRISSEAADATNDLRQLLAVHQDLQSGIDPAPGAIPTATEYLNEPHALVIHAEDLDDANAADVKGRLRPVADLHAAEDTAKFEDLPHEQKELWKEKLAAAGSWSVEEGESVLKGVFFGVIAGLVG